MPSCRARGSEAEASGILVMDAYIYQYGVGLVFFLAGLTVAAKHGYEGTLVVDRLY